MFHCVKSVQIRSFFWSVFSCIQTEYGDTGKYGPEKTPYLDTFYAMFISIKLEEITYCCFFTLVLF